MGAPNKSLVWISPTVKCLVNLTEHPFTVIPIEDIELIHFEWVHYSIKNFDMAILFKDFHSFLRICSIPSEELETIKLWAD